MKTALIAALLAAPAQPAPRPCVTEAQVEDLTFFALPPLLDALETRCGPSLPPNAYLLNGGRTLARDLGAQSASRWVGASAAMAKVGSGKMPAGISAPTARGLLHDTAVSELLAKFTPEDCRKADRLADLLSPLPPRNLAGLAFMAAEMVSEDKKKQKPFICPAPRP